MPAFRCTGCGSLLASGYPFRCPSARSGDGIDHVLVRADPAGSVRDGARTDAGARPPGTCNPFVRYRRQLSAHALACAGGLGDAGYLDVVQRLDDGLATVDGRGFAETPCAEHPELAGAVGLEEPGALWVKDETGSVSGSHKGRHLAGIMLYLLVAERAGMTTSRPTLAIASCGNAALAAATIARAVEWPLQVFVPASANPAVLARLAELRAVVTVCRREPGVAGDPCYLGFLRAVDDGAVPFCCQGSDNGLTIEGGKTIAWEMMSVVQPDAVFLQVGGGALASAVMQGFLEARREGTIDRVPSFYTVQTAGGFPLARAFDLLVARIVSRWPEDLDPPSESPADLARALLDQPALVEESLAFARSHRGQFMWPWDREPMSIAHGILDDETYDWAACVEGMLRTGGRPLVVPEATLHAANVVGSAATGIDADHTGTAGLAGLMAALEQEPALRRSRLAVIFTGVRRA